MARYVDNIRPYQTGPLTIKQSWSQDLVSWAQNSTHTDQIAASQDQGLERRAHPGHHSVRSNANSKGSETRPDVTLRCTSGVAGQEAAPRLVSIHHHLRWLSCHQALLACLYTRALVLSPSWLNLTQLITMGSFRHLFQTTTTVSPTCITTHIPPQHTSTIMVIPHRPLQACPHTMGKFSSVSFYSWFDKRADLASRSRSMSDPSLMYPVSPPSMGGSPQDTAGQVRVVQPRPKPQCWEHGCNGRQFSTFSNLLRHQREKSGQATKATCPNCHAEFTRTTARNGHLLHDKCKQKRIGS